MGSRCSWKGREGISREFLDGEGQGSRGESSAWHGTAWERGNGNSEEFLIMAAREDENRIESNVR
jgi:hypothetical protein